MPETIDLDSVEVALGRKTYRLHALGLAASERWRARFEVEVRAVLEMVQQQAGAIDLSNLAGVDLSALLPALYHVFSRVNGAMTAAAELVISYHAETEAERETIFAEATNRQALAALVEVLKLEYPFQGLLRPAQLNGRLAGMTLKNSPGPNGE